MGVHASQQASTPNSPLRHLHGVTLWKQCVVDDRVFASITTEEGRMVKDTDAGDGVSIKTPRGKQQETTSLLFPRI